MSLFSNIEKNRSTFTTKMPPPICLKLISELQENYKRLISRLNMLMCLPSFEIIQYQLIFDNYPLTAKLFNLSFHPLAVVSR